MLDSYFDIVLLCHTVESARAEQIIRYLHLFWPETQVIRMTVGFYLRTSRRKSVAYFPREQGPGALIQFVASLLPSSLEEAYPLLSVTMIDVNLRSSDELRRSSSARQK